MHLFLAACWLLVAGTFLAAPLLVPPGSPLQFDGATRVPAAGFALLLCAYNVTRWYLARARRRAVQAERARPRHAPQRDEPPNPDFDFSDPAADQTRTNPPPGGAP